MYPPKMNFSEDVITSAIFSHCILTLPGPPTSFPPPIFFPVPVCLTRTLFNRRNGKIGSG